MKILFIIAIILMIVFSYIEFSKSNVANYCYEAREWCRPDRSELYALAYLNLGVYQIIYFNPYEN